MDEYQNSFAFKLLQKFESMRERVEHYVSVVNHCPLPAFITSRDGATILYVNNAYRRLIGRSEERLQNQDWLEIIHPEDRVTTLAFWKKFLEAPVDGVPVSHVHRFVNTSTGVIIPATTYVTSVVGNGIVGYIIPADCCGMLLLGISLNCPVQQMRMSTLTTLTPPHP